MKKRLDPTDRLRRFVDAATEAGTRGATLTQRMLSFARRQQLEALPVDLVALVRGMEDLLQRSIGPRHVIELRLPKTPVVAVADAHQLELALLNLVVNARDALGETGTIEIAAAARTSADGGRRFAVLSVIDHGAGMDEETLAKAADPFFTTKPVSRGTGLGLSMVHGFVEQSSGRVSIASAKGEGTTVEIWLPAADPAELPGAGAAEAAPASSKSLRVLAVDDDALVLFSTVSMLEELGHSVEAASSAEKALSILAGDSRFDAVVSDQGMPGMTGLELANKMSEAGYGVPVLIASGYAELPGGGAVPALGKPFDAAQLSQALVKLVTNADSIGTNSVVERC